MDIKYVEQWEFDDNLISWMDFVKSYQLQDVFFNKFKDDLAEFLAEYPELAGKKRTEVTKKNMWNAFDNAVFKGYYSPYDILERLAQGYIKENDLFDQIFFIEDQERLYFVHFYEVVFDNMNDLQRFMLKQANNITNGMGEIALDVIERRSRNTSE